MVLQASTAASTEFDETAAASAVEGFLEGPGGTVVEIVLSVLFAILVMTIVKRIIYRAVNVYDRRKAGATIFINIMRVIVWGVTLANALNVLFGIDIAAILGAVGIVGVAVSLGAQQTIANLIGGVIVSVSKMVGAGDWITVGGSTEGQIIDTDWRRTIIVDEVNNTYAIPNSVMVSSIVQRSTDYAQYRVPIALSANAPNLQGLLEEMETVAGDSLDRAGYRFEDMTPRVMITGSNLGFINVDLKLYTTRDVDSRTVYRAVLPAVFTFLQEKGALAPRTDDAQADSWTQACGAGESCGANEAGPDGSAESADMPR